MIEFIKKETKVPKKLTLADVKDNQFFISDTGWLCQKRSADSYITIANSRNMPFADYCKFASLTMPISKVLPEIEFIKF